VFIHPFNWCLAASSDEEGGKMRRATVSTVSHTDAAAAVDVLLRYCEQCEQATRTMSSRRVLLNVLL